ncbi:hypothetical protein FGO68_gene10505 [Halteria grandinella]|uniref:Uncharacterized protein n=1 Tax=Halteria grandinella TaxID=5974 RepID=A0A8J8ND59_HALGN|nr:hypothetical protein FGO68_gene10505 [Halteria grandinella]
MAVDLALTVQETYAGVEFETVNTFTMPLKDLIIKSEEEQSIANIEAGIIVDKLQEIAGEQYRFNSGICIKLTKK